MRRVKTENPVFHNKLGGFIWLLFPFVCQNNPSVCASVGIRIPFVWNLKNTGFTVIELMIVLLILAVLTGLALPAMNAFIANGRVRSVADDLAGALNLTRSEAIKYSRPATACVSVRTTTDNDTCTGSDWAKGWLAWADKNGNGAIGTTEVIRKTPALVNEPSLQKGITVTTYKDQAVTAFSSLQFNADGTPTPAGSYAFLVCDSTKAAKVSKWVEVGLSGRVAVGGTEPGKPAPAGTPYICN